MAICNNYLPSVKVDFRYHGNKKSKDLKLVSGAAGAVISL